MVGCAPTPTWWAGVGESHVAQCLIPARVAASVPTP